MTISTVVDSSANPHHLHLDSVPLVDLRFLSQSELNSFSLCSDHQSFDLRRSDDLVVPVIDRSLFNESAGSRKQTYSRLRLPPRKPQIPTTAAATTTTTTASAIRRGRGRPSLASLRLSTPPTDDPERRENSLIVSLLQDMLGRRSKSTTSSSISAPTNNFNVNVALKKRFRDREEEKFYQNQSSSRPIFQGKSGGGGGGGALGDGLGMEIVNKNGVVVDINALGSLGDPYGPELRRRTVGLETEEGLLVFLRGLEGQWGSRRKKRKIVDASMFGDALPIGWKILLSLKRKEGRVWLYCRRYISPSGRQFLSCKEVSAYLLSIFGTQNGSNPSGENHHGAYELASASITGPTAKDDGKREDLIDHPPSASLSTEREKEVDLLGTENLADVEIRDLLECHICQMSFSEKDAYLQHLLSIHQRGAKRCRLGSSVGNGVIMKDGKYECQFCHKIFLERHRYNGHVGVHVRSYVRSLEASEGGTAMQSTAEPSSPRRMEASEINASVDNEVVSVAPTAAVNSSDKMSVGSPKDELDMNTIPETSEKFSMHEKPDSGILLSKLDAGDFTPQTLEFKDEQSRMPSGLSTVDTSMDTDDISIVHDPIAKPNEKTEVGVPNGELNSSSILETSTANFDNELSVGSAYSEQNTGNSIPQIFTESKEIPKEDASVDVDNTSFVWTSMDKPGDKMDAISPREKDASSFPEISGAKFNSELELGFSSSKHDTRDCIEQAFAKSKDELNIELPCNEHCRDINGNNETLTKESHVKHVQGCEMADAKLNKVDEYNNCVQSELNSSLGSVIASSNNEKDGAIEAYGRKETLMNTINEIGMSCLEEVSGSNSNSLVSSGNEQFSSVGSGVDGSFTISEGKFKLGPAKASEDNEPECDFGTSQTTCYKEFLTQNFGSMDNENIMLQSMVSDMASPLVQSSDCFTALNMISDKEQEANNLFNVNRNEKHENESGFGELRLDDVEPTSFGLGTGQGSGSLAEGPMDLAYSADLEQGLDTSVQFGWEAMLPKVGSSNQVTSVCIWCRTAFTHENVNLEKQLDSVGFICPACKAKISGQLNIFDSGMNLDNF